MISYSAHLHLHSHCYCLSSLPVWEGLVSVWEELASVWEEFNADSTASDRLWSLDVDTDWLVGLTSLSVVVFSCTAAGAGFSAPASVRSIIVMLISFTIEKSIKPLNQTPNNERQECQSRVVLLLTMGEQLLELN